jgi:MFS family permease
MHDSDRRRGRAARPGSSRAKVLNVVRVSSGNFLEMFDFMVFGYYASSIGRTFFPNENAFASLMLALMTFGAGFLMRPIGAVILGAYIDRFGRRSGLILTLGLMAIGTLLIACLPGYAVIGVAAPIVILISRLVQGFSAGVELGGVSVYLSEIATPRAQGLLRQLAVGEPAGRSHVRSFNRCGSSFAASSSNDGTVGLASAFLDRMLDYPTTLLAEALVGRNGRVSGQQTAPEHSADSRYPRT